MTISTELLEIAADIIASEFSLSDSPVSERAKSGSSCGANAQGGGGFQPGNTCGKRDGKGSESSEGGGKGASVNPKILAWAREKFGDDTTAENFAKWFGDSKVVDEDGNPLVVYHGTKGEFTEFDPTRQSSESRLSQQGPGFYFTDNKKEASAYGKAMSVFLAVENPLVIEKRGVQKLTKEQAVELYSRGNNDYFFNEWVPFFTGEKNGGKSREEIASSYVDSLMSKSGFDGTDKAILQNLKRAYKSYGEDNGYGDLLKNIKEVTGFDGVIEKVSEKTSVYTAFSSPQIKSATGNSGTFDPKDPNITKSGSGCGANAEGGGGFQPGNTCGSRDGGAGGVSGYKQKEKERILGTIEKAELPARLKGIFSKDMAETIDAMPEAAAARLNGVKEIKWAMNTTRLAEALRADGEEIPEGITPAGAWDVDNQRLYLAANSYSSGKSGTYKHELAHVVDYNNGALKFSSSDEWKSAWQDELSGQQLTRYASTNSEEGFAEFARFAWGQREWVKKKFPKSAAFFEKRGLL